MRLRQVFLTLGIFTCAGAASIVQAESREDRFREWDRNRDGRLEIGEFTGHRGNFNAMDCDKDGYLTMDEFSQRYRCGEQSAQPSQPTMGGQVGRSDRVDPNSPEGRMRSADRNNDGVLSRSEWTSSGQAANFDRVDRNKDDVVTYDEYVNRPTEGSREARFDVLDRNKDGVLSRVEYRGESVKFNVADRNRDGRVSRAEFLEL